MRGKVSEDKIFDDYINGLPDDFKLEKSKIRKKPVDVKSSTVQISIKMEYDLLKKIKEVADDKQLPYQTFIKQILRDYLNKPSMKQKLESIEQRLLLLENKIAI